MKIEVAKILNKLRDSKKLPVIEITYLSGKNTQGVLMNPRGSHSSPSINTPCVLLKVDDGNRFIIPITSDRPKGLKEKDYAIFAHDLASVIKLMAGGDIEVNANKQVVINTPEVIVNSPVSTFNGVVNIAGQLNLGGGMSGYNGVSSINVDTKIDNSADIEAEGISLSSHTHGGVQTGSGNTGGPQ